ncbi:MAG: carboxypeptidase-like regulatory domain-containing protein, partial [Pyrinomonadaceae bacterium]
MRKYLTFLFLTCAFFLLKPVEDARAQIPGVPGQECGPIALLGIDAEDTQGCTVDHDPNQFFAPLVQSIYNQANNGQTGILVIGGGKDLTTPSVCPMNTGTPGDDVTAFWRDISTSTGIPVTFVNGAAAISAVNFFNFRLIAVASSVANTPSGGLTQAENDAFAARQFAIASFVDRDGGLLGFTNDFANPYAYLMGFGTFTTRIGLQYSNITPTAAGIAVGITDALDQDTEFWHDEYLTFPANFQVLATNAGQTPANDAAVAAGTVLRDRPPGTIGNAAAIGGISVCSSLNPTAATATISGRIRDVNGKSASRVIVTLTNLSTGESLTTRTN